MHVRGLGAALFEIHALQKLRRQRRIERPVQDHFVFFFHVPRRMRDCLGKRAVIAEEQKPLAFSIEAPDMGQVPGIARDQVIDRRLAALRLTGTQAA